MAVKHRKQRGRVKRIATLGAATATVTALTAGIAPAAVANAAAVHRDVDLTSGVQIFPPPDQIPDLTGGLGTQAYNLYQQVGAQAMTAFVQNFNLVALLKAAGIDPSAALTDALNKALGGAIGGSGLDDLSIDVTPLLTALGDQLGLGSVIDALAAVEIVPTDVPVGDLVSLLGVDLSDPLSITDAAGIRLITSGGPFTLLRLLGVDLGWTPPFPNSIADQINTTPYLTVGMVGLLNKLGIGTSGIDAIDGLIKAYNLTHEHDKLPLLTDIPDAIDLRVPIVAGWGFGAFAAGMAYPQVVADLPNQPGGAAYTGTDPLLGSFTILPMILIDNPGRANGGIMARFYPIFGLAGIDTVTPETQVQSSTKGDSALNNVQFLGLTLGGANLIPIKVDATAEYLPLSDFAAWPNPFTLANNVAAGMFPTYILRDQTVNGIVADLVAQLGPQVTSAITDYLEDPGDDPTKGPKLNFYYTLRAQSLPLLEPTYLTVDALNLLTGANFNNPIGTALSPALTSLVNLGYTDVYRTTDGQYDRTLTEAAVPTAFGTLPADIDWTKVPADVTNSLIKGIEQAVSDGLINKNPAAGSNVLATLLSLLGVGNISPLSGSALDTSAITAALEGVTGGLSSLNTAPSLTTTTFAPQSITSTNTNSNVVNLKTAQGADPVDALEGGTTKLKTATDDAREQVEKTVKDANDRVKASAEKARVQANKAVKDAQSKVSKIADNGRKQIESTVKGVEKSVKDATDKVKSATSSAKSEAKNNAA